MTVTENFDSTTPHPALTAATTNTRKLFMGETALKAKRKLAMEIGANLSEDSQSSGNDEHGTDLEKLYIHKLKSKHLKSQLKKLLNQSA